MQKPAWALDPQGFYLTWQTDSDVFQDFWEHSIYKPMTSMGEQVLFK